MWCSCGGCGVRDRLDDAAPDLPTAAGATTSGAVPPGRRPSPRICCGVSAGVRGAGALSGTGVVLNGMKGLVGASTMSCITPSIKSSGIAPIGLPLGWNGGRGSSVGGLELELDCEDDLGSPAAGGIGELDAGHRYLLGDWVPGDADAFLLAC